MLDVLHRDYITLAECKGLPSRVIIRKHAFRNAMLPIVTILGLRIGAILAGAVHGLELLHLLLHGVGRLIITSIQSGNYAVVGGDPARGDHGRAGEPADRHRVHVPRSAHPVWQLVVGAAGTAATRSSR